MANLYIIGEALTDLHTLLGTWDSDSLRLAVPRGNVAGDVRAFVASLLRNAAGRDRKVAGRIAAAFRGDAYAHKLAVLEALRHYVRALELWRPPPDLRQKHAHYMTRARSATGAFARMCKYEIVCGRCSNLNCPYAHAGPARVRDDDSWLDHLPNQEELHAAMAA